MIVAVFATIILDPDFARLTLIGLTCVQEVVAAPRLAYLTTPMVSVTDQQPIKKMVGRTRPSTTAERLESLWQMYVFWKQTPAGQKPQEIPSHVRKLVQKPQ